jgi:hypothetical protein
MTNAAILDDDLAELQDEARSFGCAYSGHLTYKQGPDGNLYELSELRSGLKPTTLGLVRPH